MERLERWRDANEAIAPRAAQPRGDRRGPGGHRRAARLGLGGPRSPRLRGLPRREADARDRQGRETTTGRVDVHGRRLPRGRRARRARGERDRDRRSALTDRAAGRASRSRSGSSAALGSRRDARRASTTPPPRPGSARRGTIRPCQVTNHLISDIWPGSGVAVLDFDRRRRRGPLRRRRRALDPLPQRRARALHGRHGEGRASRSPRPRASPRPASPRATSTATAIRTSS